MTKVLFILSAVVILVSAFFAYQNGQAFTEMRKKAATVNVSVKSAISAAGKVKKEVTDVAEATERVSGELGIEEQKVKAQKLKIAQADNDTKTAQEQLDVQNQKLAKLRQDLDKLPTGMKPETLQEDVAALKKSIIEMQVTMEAKKKEVETEEAKMADANKQLQEVVTKIEDRKKSFDRNSLVARVVAVNPDWGFVVVDAGQSRGITEATKLLVTRGAQTVGKLSIVSVQGERTVANILPDTLVEGLSIAPGDRVILESLYK